MVDRAGPSVASSIGLQMLPPAAASLPYRTQTGVPSPLPASGALALPAPTFSPMELPEHTVRTQLPKPEANLPKSVDFGLQKPAALNDASEANRISSEEYEQAMLEGLKLKKRKSKDAKPEAPMKRPAAAASSFTSTHVVQWDASDLSKNLHSFTSKHYHLASKAAASKGLSIDEQKSAGQMAYKAAKDLWLSKQ